MTVRRLIPVVLVMALGLAGWLPIQTAVAEPFAQTNLLVNPGFEDPFVPFGGDTTRLVANGWSAWHVPQRTGDEGFRNLKPEYQPASASNPERILEGNNAQEYFSFFATHTGGVYQQVLVPQGSDVRFSVFVYVWSTSGDDPAVSRNPGRVQVQVGIDPNGGTDGESERILWSLPLEFYDEYRQVSVRAENVSDRITVFVRTTFDLPQKNNNVYLDNAALIITQSAEPTLTSTTAPTSTPFVTATPTAVAGPTSTPLAPGLATPTQELDETVQPSATVSATATATPTRPSSEFPYQIVYRVVAGDTVGALALRFGSSVEAIIRANGLNSEALIYVDQELIIPVREQPVPTATPTLSLTSIGIIPTATPIGILPTPTPLPTTVPGGQSTITYVVVAGDNLSRIAARFNTTVGTLVQLNGILNPNLIKVGQQLRIPGIAPVTPVPTPQPQRPATHVVQRGENLYRISLRYGVRLDQLARLNGITNVNRIYVGQVLVLP